MLAGRLQRRRKVLRGAVAHVARFGQCPGHDRVNGGRQFAVERRDQQGRVVDDFLNHGEVGVAIKRARARQQLVQHHTGGKQVGPGVNGFAFQLLGRHVFERSDNRALSTGSVARVLDTRHTKVCQLDASTGLHQQVGGLDVAMHNFLAVRVCQGRQQVAHDGQGLLEGVHLAMVQVVLEVLPLDILHHQKCDVAITVRVVYADDVGVLQARGRPGLGAKAHLVFSRGFIGQVFNLDGFDGNAAVQIGVTPLVNQSHRALAQHADQIVSTQFFKAHGVFCRS